MLCDIIVLAVTRKLGLVLDECQTSRHNQTKDREKEGFIITCSK